MTPTLTQYLTHNKHHITHILFVFAHPDDEILSSGGLIQWVLLHGYIPHVVVLTHGEKGSHRIKKTKQETARIRECEFFRVMETLGVRQRMLLRYPDGGLEGKKENIMKDIETVCRKSAIDCIITHEGQQKDEHEDHKATALCAMRVASSMHIPLFFAAPFSGREGKKRHAGYYTVFLTKNMVARKMELLRLYESQFSPEYLSRLAVRQLFFPNEYYRKCE